jgi:photoactive yellow protein
VAAIEDRISGLNDGELDTFESGITRLDRAGTVRFSNKAEERFTKRKAEDTIGLNFFREVAPCAAVRNFQGRFEEFAAPELRSKTFGFIYPFWLGHKQVKITMMRRPSEPENVYLLPEFMGAGGSLTHGLDLWVIPVQTNRRNRSLEHLIGSQRTRAAKILTAVGSVCRDGVIAAAMNEFRQHADFVAPFMIRESASV